MSFYKKIFNEKFGVYYLWGTERSVKMSMDQTRRQRFGR